MTATVSRYVKLVSGPKRFRLDSSERVLDHEVRESVHRLLGSDPDIETPPGLDHEGRRVQTFAVSGGPYAVVVTHHKEDTGQTLL